MSGTDDERFPVDAVACGFWIRLSAANVRAVVTAGFDWIGVDGQHGQLDERAIMVAISAALPHRRVLVRTPDASPAWIGRVLDFGADGVIAPMIESGEEAAALVSAARYPPSGDRSFGPIYIDSSDPAVRQVDDYVRARNRRTVVAAMVESARGLENVDEIAATAGIDMIFVGPWDLALSTGHTIQSLFDSGVEGPLGAIVRSCSAHGVIPGGYAGSRDVARRMSALGYQVLATASDVDVLSAARPPTFEGAHPDVVSSRVERDG